jgi:ABC-type nitrate/sulfonate/bicarbonate transport system ATPase subunit
LGNLAASLVDVSIKRGSGLRSTTVVKDLSFDIARGEILALVGTSGRGKTTVLHALAGLIGISKGDIVHHSINTDVGRATGVVFQDALLLPWLTVNQNIRLGYKFKANRSGTKSDFDARVVSLLDILGIKDLADRKVSELSGGQAQRVAMARTVATQPRVLLLDEPFSALDAATRGALQNWLIELRNMLQLTVVIVTHDIDEALTLADRVLVLPAQGETLKIFSSTEKSNTNKIKQEILASLASYEI